MTPTLEKWTALYELSIDGTAYPVALVASEKLAGEVRRMFFPRTVAIARLVRTRPAPIETVTRPDLEAFRILSNLILGDDNEIGKWLEAGRVLIAQHAPKPSSTTHDTSIRTPAKH